MCTQLAKRNKESGNNQRERGKKDFFKINLNCRDKLNGFDCVFEQITETALALFG